MTASTVLNSLTGERLTKEYFNNLTSVVNDPMNPTRYLGIDPGELNGICGYDSKMYLQFMLVVQHLDIPLFLNCFRELNTIVCEDYRIYHNKAQQHINSRLTTTRVIGRIETVAELKGIDLIMQPAAIKPIGYKLIGEKPLPHSNKQNHAKDAHVHFMYWAIKEKLLVAQVGSDRKITYVLKSSVTPNEVSEQKDS